jgi:Cu/Ag efflux pump CusA
MKQHASSQEAHSAGAHGRENHYARLGVMIALSFVAMFVLMYAMVDVVDNVVMNFNQVYMAGLMAAPMVLIELVLMSGMYKNKRLNAAIAGVAVLAAIVFFMLIRRQTAIGDRQFLRSMIPHHGGAVLMCQQASLSDARIKQLCEAPEGIIASQRKEIEQMKAMLRTVK